ncbi:armadillo repeat-containing protein gudu isoform X2 [Zootermopsis nevadensis]|uniref:armadillo repeat-containing protein gudu isoform X2 n=1 Tax=Zootermopsis nevadensis TaxID=136037 RepID=UPI000B8E34BA|nr:armadillo repeat-containing protein gudu isoform X2 [Zootermopsis nevadensis]
MALPSGQSGRLHFHSLPVHDVHAWHGGRQPEPLGETGFGFHVVGGCSDNRHLDHHNYRMQNLSSEQHSTRGVHYKADKEECKMSPATDPGCVCVSEAEEVGDSSTQSDSSEEDDELRWHKMAKGSDVPSEYWHIQKLIKYMKAGNQTATIVSLCCLKDHDLTTEINQTAIRDIGGLEALVNLLETDDIKCKLGSLSVLSEISQNADIRRGITDLGAVPILVIILSDQSRDLQILAAETIANIGKIRKARRAIRKCGGIPKLVDLLDVSNHALTTPFSQLTPQDEEEVRTARAGAKALWSISQSKKNRDTMRKAGCVHLLARLLKSVHGDVVVPVMGTLQQCASENEYQLAVQTEGMVADMVHHLRNDNRELKKLCASAIFKCAQDSVTRDLVRQHGGLDPLVKLAKDISIWDDKPLLAAVTGAIWKCAISPENVHRLDELKTIDTLVSLLSDENGEVLTNAVGGLAECAKFQDNRTEIRTSGGIPRLIMLLNGNNGPMLENVCRVLGECANEADSMDIIQNLDGVRLIWSQLKHPSPAVQASAAWALCPCIRNATDSGEMVRSFVGGLELIVSRLKSTDTNVLASVCAALAKIAQDKESLAVITDHGVVPMLAELVLTVCSQAIPRGICGGQSATGTGLSTSQTLVLLLLVYDIKYSVIGSKVVRL